MKTSELAPATGPASPCVRRCSLDEQDICLGCHRSLSEILAWGRSDAQARATICATARARAGQRQPASR